MLKRFNLKEDAPRLVLLGNSNVGKSSITRFLIKRKNLTTGKIGKHAGSTVSLNLYTDPNIPYQIVDLPGYGAMTRTSKEMKERIQKKIISYVEKDQKNIFLALVIFNCMRVQDELEKWYYNNEETIPLSYEFVTWLNELDLPSLVVLNKTDKIRKNELIKIETEVKKVFKDLNVEILGMESEGGLLGILPTSAKLGTNMNELKDVVNLFFEKCSPNVNDDNEFIDIFKEKPIVSEKQAETNANGNLSNADNKKTSKNKGKKRKTAKKTSRKISKKTAKKANKSKKRGKRR